MSLMVLCWLLAFEQKRSNKCFMNVTRVQAMVDELSIGPCMALELSSTCEKCPEGPPLPPGFTVAAFRQVCGPHDSVLGI